MVPQSIVLGSLVTNQGHKMSDRQNTLMCMFDLRIARIMVFQIYECIYEKTKLPENDIRMIQIDGPRRHVLIKFAKTKRMHSILHDTKGQMEFRHDNSELSMVKTEPAGMGVRRIRIASLPPEMPGTIRKILTKYGEVKDITEDARTRTCRCTASNGIRIAIVSLKQHIASHMSIAKNRVLISCEEQPRPLMSVMEQGTNSRDTLGESK